MDIRPNLLGSKPSRIHSDGEIYRIYELNLKYIDENNLSVDILIGDETRPLVGVTVGVPADTPVEHIIDFAFSFRSSEISYKMGVAKRPKESPKKPKGSSLDLSDLGL